MKNTLYGTDVICRVVEMFVTCESVLPTYYFPFAIDIIQCDRPVVRVRVCLLKTNVRHVFSEVVCSIQARNSLKVNFISSRGTLWTLHHRRHFPAECNVLYRAVRGCPALKYGACDRNVSGVGLLAVNPFSTTSQCSQLFRLACLTRCPGPKLLLCVTNFRV